MSTPPNTVTLSPESLEQLAELIKGETNKDPFAPIQLSIANAARRYDISQKTLRRMIDREEIKAYRFGGTIRLRIRDLDRAAKPFREPSPATEAGR